MKDRKLKVYFWYPDADADEGIAVIAENSREAKKLGASWWGCNCGHEDADWFILQRCKLIQDADVTGLEKGALEDGIEGLKRGIYGYAISSDCPRCGADDGDVYYDRESKEFSCTNCQDAEMCPKCGKYTIIDDSKKCEDCDD